MNIKGKKYLLFWLRLSLVILVLMVVIGGITRLTQSGLSIPYWKPITGIFPPIDMISWQNEFNEYKKYPEYNKQNYNMSIEEYKIIYYWEYFHRMIGRMIGLLFFFPFIYFYYKNYLDKNLVKKLLFLLFLGMLQGFMGWYMVKSGLVENPQVSHYRLSAHLFLAFIIIAYIYKVEISLKYFKQNKINKFQFFNKFINIIIVVFFIQIIYGAFTAGLKAGKLWNTFPLIEGKLIPDNLFSIDPLYLNLFEHKKMVQFIHRCNGILLMLLIYVFSFKVQNLKPILDNKSRGLIAIVSCQVFLGIITLISKSSIVLSSFHQILAIFLLLQLINIKHFLKYE